MATPTDAPPGVTIRYLGRPTAGAWAAWLVANPPPRTIANTRPIMRPRLLLVHTNGASNEGTWQAAQNWSMAAPANTKPHYQVDRDGTAVKFLPSDRVGIANYKAAPFSLAIETADEGWGAGKPGNLSGFTPAQGEAIAQIIAWESALWGFPIEYPTRWDGTGVAAHTEPFGYPYWTNSVGKPCPGSVKKQQLRDWIMPRARAIRDAAPKPDPTPEQPATPTEDTMHVYRKNGKNAVWLADQRTRIHVPSEAAQKVLEGKYGPTLLLDESVDLETLGQQVLSMTPDI